MEGFFPKQRKEEIDGHSGQEPSASVTLLTKLKSLQQPNFNTNCDGTDFVTKFYTYVHTFGIFFTMKL